MKNNSLKTSSISHEVKTPRGLNKENMSAKFRRPLTGNITMKKTFALPATAAALVALFALATHATAWDYSPPAAPAKAEEKAEEKPWEKKLEEKPWEKKLAACRT